MAWRRLGDRPLSKPMMFSLPAHICVTRPQWVKSGKRLYVASIDYMKAFDFIDRVSLWDKMIAMGVNGKILHVIYNLYHKAKSCVKINVNLSDYFTRNVGVRREENLSPPLFFYFPKWFWIFHQPLLQRPKYACWGSEHILRWRRYWALFENIYFAVCGWYHCASRIWFWVTKCTQRCSWILWNVATYC